ncbi:hypothetical protein PJJ30_18435 [Mycobacterium kansasii]|uniref:Uncharacterized protein n=1 Tax=Mycobacterium kansasii TaxID=1768 RepID=A0A7G1I512_MYCKA|nr:hypothetical protein [Mycobacterium persicum]BCI86077.1 hypothetical protein NIIDMKKI_12830 [Mycobacterium kansasii]
MLNTQISEEYEQWRSRPEGSEGAWVHAFGLYFLLNIPDDEAFDGALSVGVSGPSPDEAPADHSPSVVLGYTGDSGARLTNVLLQPDEARQLAAHLLSAAQTTERSIARKLMRDGDTADDAAVDEFLEQLRRATENQ